VWSIVVTTSPEGIAHDRPLAGPAGQALVVLDLEARETLVVGACVADELGADGALRVGALLLRIGVDTGEALLDELRRLPRVGEAFDVDEARLLREKLRVERIRVDAEQAVRGDGHLPRLRHLPGVGVHRRRLLADCELHARTVEDRPAPRRDRQRLAVLPLRHAAERRGVDALEPDGPRERAAEDEHERGEQQADPAVGLLVGRSHFASWT
jgi:hypothetical protein